MNPADPFGLIGQVLDGQFRVDKFVGEGGFSIVYRGLHIGLNEPIAIKCLKLPPAIGSALVESFVRRFRDESRIHYRLSQGNLAIARSMASGTTMSSTTSALVPFMVLEWLDGRSLAQDFEVRRQQGHKGRSLDDVVKLLDTAAQGLAFAHSQGVVHRDVNPGNLFLAERRQGETGVMTKVLDFGVAKVVSDHALELGPRAATLGQIRIFAPAYGSPEQFDENMGKVGPASDVYSFALIVLEAMRDQPVREGEYLGEFALMALEPNGRPTPRSLGVPVGDGVEELFKRAGALRPEGRPADMGEFWGGLKHAMRADALSGKEPHADHVPSKPGSSWKPHAPAAGVAASVRADMSTPIVEVSRPGSVAPPPATSAMHSSQPVGRGTIRMHTPAPPPAIVGPGGAVAKPLVSTLVMEPRIPPPPQTKPGLASTLVMASPYARSQDVPPNAATQLTPAAAPGAGAAHLPSVQVSTSTPAPPPPGAPTGAMSDPAFAAARAMADAAAATVASTQGERSFVAAREKAYAAVAAANAPRTPAPPPRAEVPTVVPPKPKSSVKVIGVVVGALLVGGIAALVVKGVRPGAAPPSAVVASDTAAAAMPAPPASASAPTAATAAPTTATAEQAASSPPPTGAVTPAPVAAAPTPAVTPTPTATPTPMPTPTPTPTPTATPTPTPMPTPTATATPTPTPTPTPTATPTPSSQGFDPTVARSALDLMNGVLASCRRPGGKTGDGTINVTFNPNGKVDKASVDEPPFVATPEGACVASRFKQTKMAPFDGTPGSIVYTFHIPN